MSAELHSDAVQRMHIAVEGIVQGVGFRPFVAALAQRLELAGFVGNDTSGVFIEVEGRWPALSRFLTELTSGPPPLARVERVRTEARRAVGDVGFRIVASAVTDDREALVAADAGTCDECCAEIRDPTSRRYGYAFTNCTSCGPRFTIVRDVPYDRQRTTMAAFEMCSLCREEFEDPLDRRFHAQPVCCADCGPMLRLLGANGHEARGDPVTAAVTQLERGEIVAIKGIGGYHLAADARNDAAVAALRARKHREDRPFALMVTDVASARELCTVNEAEAKLLSSPQRPIVLLARRAGTAVASSVAPRASELGIMLAYSPLHLLLLDAFGGPIVMTSGNRSDEPIAYDDADAVRRLTGVADSFLTHDRAIHTRVDDSVARSVSGQPMLLRRSRGYTPSPLQAPWPFPRPVLGCGAELKNTFCLGRGRHAFVSHHIGDLGHYETQAAFIEGVAHFQRLFSVQPEVVAYDLHPDYQSTRYALSLDGVDLVGVQHHHAHIAACLADNQTDAQVIGVAFDGTGYGPDGTVWGGEFLIADLCDARRAAHLEPVRLPGGAAAIREPWRMAAAYLNAAFATEPAGAVDLRLRHGERWDTIRSMIDSGLSSPLTSSAGRLFDAVAALLDVRDETTYEGQAAIELEQLADRGESTDYHVSISDDDVPQIRAADLIRAVVADRAAGVPRRAIAARFHQGVASLIVTTCSLLRERHDLGTVALSGGVFQNTLLLTQTTERLIADGFVVLSHHQIPPNDGGISLGQAVVAGARDRAAR